MKKLIKKSIAAAAAVSSALAPMASQLTTVSAARLGTVAAVSTAAAFAPSAAYAQSGKRVCGVIWQHKTNKNRKRAVFMKVNKNDRFYCAAIFGDAYLLSRGGKEWVSPKNYYHVACEEFSGKFGLNYNLCPGVDGYVGITRWR